MERRAVSFKSEGTRIKGYLRTPDGAPPHASLIMCHGFGGTMDRLEDAARMFCEAGYAVLTFDYRGFGESEGRPRQLVSVRKQLADIAAAIAFARGEPSIDPARIALWGSSLGGGHVVVAAAQDGKIAAVISQVPFNGFPKSAEGRSTRDTRKLLRAILSDWLRGKLGLPRRYIKAVGRPGELAVMASDEAAEIVETMIGSGETTWENRVVPAGILEMARYKPSDHAKKLDAPLLLSAAEQDRETPLELVLEIAKAAPRGEIRRYPIRHFDVYRPDIREAVIGDQISFLRAHMPP